MTNISKGFIIAGAVIFGAFTASSARIMAVSSEGQSGLRIQAAAQTVGIATSSQNSSQRAVSGAIERCPMIESRIQMKVVDFDNNKVRHLEVYANMKEKLAKIGQKLSEKGVDASQLNADLSVLDGKINKFASDYASYIGKLKEAQATVCGKPKQQFLAKLKEARSAMKIVHQDALDIRAYYAGTIKPDLQDLKLRMNGSSLAPLDKAGTSTDSQGAGFSGTMPQSIEPLPPTTGIIE